MYRRSKYCSICGQVAKIGVKAWLKNQFGRLFAMQSEFVLCDIKCLEAANKKDIVSTGAYLEVIDTFCPFQKEKDSLEKHKIDAKEFLECDWAKGEYGYDIIVEGIKSGKYLVEKIGEHFRICDNDNRPIYTYYKPVAPSEAWSWSSERSDSANHTTSSAITVSGGTIANKILYSNFEY